LKVKVTESRSKIRARQLLGWSTMAFENQIWIRSCT